MPGDAARRACAAGTTTSSPAGVMTSQTMSRAASSAAGVPKLCTCRLDCAAAAQLDGRVAAGMYRVGLTASVGELATATRPDAGEHGRSRPTARYSTSVGPSNTEARPCEPRRGSPSAPSMCVTVNEPASGTTIRSTPALGEREHIVRRRARPRGSRCAAIRASSASTTPPIRPGRVAAAMEPPVSPCRLGIRVGGDAAPACSRLGAASAGQWFWGKPEVDAAVRGGVEPAAGDGLLAGEEVEPVDAVGLGVAEERVLPAAEGVVGDGNGDGHVDADHADLHLVLEAAGGAAVVGEDRGAVAELRRS